MEIQALLLGELMALDPRASLDRALALLMNRAGADACGLFLTRGNVELHAGHHVDQAALDRARIAWMEDAVALRDGRPTWRETWCVWPIESPRGVALVYLTAARPLAIQVVRDVVAGLGLAIASVLDGEDQKPEDVESYLEAERLEAIERRQLLILLNKNEWTIARVARILGVTRRTVYNKIERFEIERLRVPKSLRRLPRPGPAR